ncbi:hypothetical protein [Sinorhizobium meliloti]|uniref:hypothetical protein n=1 Tax=Rhizobium meliloti TaxID=382 RepID=UPI000B49C4BD|nr:hypothetical protein [Sinorhizobium meliloti]ASP68633.1 hypothetical protein CDO29_29990 [Sinorhizobium meliloti]MQX01389.1 hypothetical protein [Sinorhizobium meliloti]RVG05661.1 hypothetical protein CN234_24080 [Sinorhizobium meliloti]RVK44207.1 hypothetical protein CN160_27320 [Sinorhizobium meliloti]
MAGEIFIAMTGDGNELWADCLERKVVALGYDKPYFEAWRAGDREEFFNVEMKASPKAATESDVRGRATTWFNRATRITESENDIWLHRAGNDLYWAVTTEADAVFEEYDGKVMLAKPVTSWSRRSRRTVALTWNSIHPKAKDYLTTQQAVLRVADATMKEYLEALIGGDNLKRWHDRPEWRLRLGAERGRTLGSNVELSELVLTRMMMTIRNTVRNSNGQQVLRTLKDKRLLCTDAEMKAHLAYLMVRQEGLCAITGLPMHVDGQENLDHDMLASADRIDSNGHYEPKNVQLVCQFVNFWKCSQENGRFMELLDKVVANRFLAQA